MSVGVSVLVPAALMTHALAVVAALLSSRHAAWCRRMAFGGSALASALTTSAAVVVLTSGQPLAGVLFTHSASALVVDYVVTPLSAWFLLLLGVVAIPVAIYSIGYMAHAVRPSRTPTVGVTFNVLIAAVSVVFVVNDVIGFLFALASVWRLELMQLLLQPALLGLVLAAVATVFDTAARRRQALSRADTTFDRLAPVEHDSRPSGRSSVSPTPARTAVYRSAGVSDSGGTP